MQLYQKDLKTGVLTPVKDIGFNKTTDMRGAMVSGIPVFEADAVFCLVRPGKAYRMTTEQKTTAVRV